MKGTEECPFCEVPSDEIASSEIKIEQAVAAGKAKMTVSAEPAWRQEVGRRLDEYRARRGGVSRAEKLQPRLPFRLGAKAVEVDEVELPTPKPARPAVRSRGNERMEIWIQPELEFSSGPGDRARPQTATVPVASLSERRDAGLVDALFVLITCAAFAGLFRSLGGEIAVDKVDAIVCGAVLYLFYGLYFLIFTVFSGPTPGMLLRGLSVVRLDGSLPETRQLVWRGFGYLVSAATLMLGFIWAAWDEDHFTWHDRMSQTYVTSAAPAPEAGPIEIRPRQRSLARK